MKRSERYYQKARHTALWAAAILTAVCAGCVWSVRVMLEFASCGTALFLVSLAGLFLCGGMLREALRLARLARNEARWEWERGIRPRV